MKLLALSFTGLLAAAGAAAAAPAPGTGHCVDASGKTVPRARCQPQATLPRATPGVYTTLPQRQAPSRGPQAQVYSSNPGGDAAAPSPPPGPSVPIVIQLNAGAPAPVPARKVP